MDYTHVSRSLTFNAAITTQMVEVPIIDDHIVEHSEIINLTLVSTDSAVILNPSTSTITIEDVDGNLHTVCRSLNICKCECNLFCLPLQWLQLDSTKQTIQRVKMQAVLALYYLCKLEPWTEML